jgi:uncharacterized protein (TIGR00725 family)
MKRLISVCGSDEKDESISSSALEIAEDVGKFIAQKGFVLVCGGRGGIMKAACKGAKEVKGITVGILPLSKKESNEYIDIPIVTGLGTRRNFLVVNASDAVIAIGGRWGTLNEISFSLIFKKPLILIKGTGGIVDKIIKGEFIKNINSPFFIVDSAKNAVEKVFEFLTD